MTRFVVKVISVLTIISLVGRGSKKCHGTLPVKIEKRKINNFVQF